MIRLLYDHEFFNAFPYSGITRYFHEVIRRVTVDPDFRASLFMGFHLNKYGVEADRHLLERFFGVARPRIPRTARAFTALNNALFPIFARRSRADVFHQTYYAPLYPEFRGKRVITVHDLTYEIMPDLFPGGREASRLMREAVARADGIISVSDSTKRDLVRILGVPEARIRTIHHGNSLRIDPGPRQQVPGDYLLYVGQRVPHKNFGTLLRAYALNARLAGAHRLVCFGGNPFTPAELAEIRALGAEGKVMQLSGPDSLLANLYKHARLLAYPSLYEGFGLPLIEAMGFGCPIVASGVSSLPEVACKAALYFDPRSEEELSAALERVVSDGGLRAELSAAAIARAADFSWDRCARGHMDLYREVAGA